MRTIAVLAIVLSCSASLSGGQNSPKAALVAAAETGSVEQLVRALVNAGVPAGAVVIKEEPARQVPHSNTHGGPVGAEDLSLAIAAFQSRRPDYEILTTPENSVLILPVASGGCEDLIRTRRRTLTTSGPAIEVVYRIFRTWTDDTSMYVPPGLVASIGAGARSEEAKARAERFRTPVAVAVESGTILEALQSIIRQVDNLGWRVRQIHAKPYGSDGPIVGCNLSLLDGTAGLETSWTIVVKAPR